MGYYENDGFIFACDLGIIFLGIPNWEIDGFTKNFSLKVWSYSHHRKICGLFPCIPISEGFIFL